MGGSGEHFSASNNDFCNDFAKVDFDKPLFGGGKDASESDAGK
jgi:hypothetical protein